MTRLRKVNELTNDQLLEGCTILTLVRNQSSIKYLRSLIDDAYDEFFKEISTRELNNDLDKEDLYIINEKMNAYRCTSVIESSKDFKDFFREIENSFVETCRILAGILDQSAINRFSDCDVIYNLVDYIENKYYRQFIKYCNDKYYDKMKAKIGNKLYFRYLAFTQLRLSNQK